MQIECKCSRDRLWFTGTRRFVSLSWPFEGFQRLAHFYISHVCQTQLSSLRSCHRNKTIMSSKLVMHGVVLTDYVFDFSTVLNNSETYKVFFNFQEKEFNTDGVLFVLEQQALEKQTNETEATRSALHIFETYGVVFFLIAPGILPQQRHNPQQKRKLLICLNSTSKMMLTCGS